MEDLFGIVIFIVVAAVSSWMKSSGDSDSESSYTSEPGELDEWLKSLEGDGNRSSATADPFTSPSTSGGSSGMDPLPPSLGSNSQASGLSASSNSFAPPINHRGNGRQKTASKKRKSSSTRRNPSGIKQRQQASDSATVALTGGDMNVVGGAARGRSGTVHGVGQLFNSQSDLKRAIIMGVLLERHKPNRIKSILTKK